MAATALALVQPGAAEASPVSDAHAMAMQAALFPGLSALEASALPLDARRLLSQRRARIDTCGDDARCVVLRSVWADDERRSFAASVAATRSRRTSSFRAPDDGEAAQLERELVGLNGVLQVYGLGSPPRNPELEGPLFRAGASLFQSRVADAVALARAGGDPEAVDRSLGLAVALLDANDRQDAVAYEPLDRSQNAAALQAARSTEWSRYAFTAIIVLGNGPELEGEALSPRGKLRVRLAAERFAEGVAPFVIVSGGAVHPRGTTFNEAVEMRRALIERYGIPANRIVLEPYARTTSTNLRNAVRRLVAMGAPLGREMLAVTDAEHSRILGAPEMKARAVSELGYEPAALGRRLSDTGLTFTPSPSSLRVDPLDPLDP